jgi:two-component system response regulator RegX3
MSERILVVEDEESYVEALQLGLAREGFETPDLVLLDVMLPRLSGIDVCRQIRQHSSVPIIMVTAKSSEIDTVVGLEVGADDYVAKPYRLRELIARIRVALRRGVEVTGPNASGDDVLIVGDIELNESRHSVSVRGIEVALPLKEYDVLRLLMINVGKVLTREILIDRVWGADYVGDTKTLDVHIKRLRAKVEPDPTNPQQITTVRGVGYRLNPPQRS